MQQEFETGLRFLKAEFGTAPEVALVLGSGLSDFVDRLEAAKSVARERIPGAAASSVVGHRGAFSVGSFSGERLCVVAGRLHGYEGHTPNEVVALLRLLRMWGVKDFILTNAAGSTHRLFKPGTLSLIADHLNLTGQNPLTGKELFGGPRFPDLSDAYSHRWRKEILKVARKPKHKSLQKLLKVGVYAGVAGPNFETAAEIKMLKRLGADLVGMSTVWETIALHQMGARVLGISLVTNLGTGISGNALTHEEVLEMTKARAVDFARLVAITLSCRKQSR